ncbi:MAG TPA: hypothetical protein VFW50_13095 [Streptosporangiaceae bacterium]|nr:hypothetical protein [Streptosporangiaceae bacterium]
MALASCPARQGQRPTATALKKGQAGLIVVYATNMADQIAAFLKAHNKHVSK